MVNPGDGAPVHVIVTTAITVLLSHRILTNTPFHRNRNPQFLAVRCLPRRGHLEIYVLEDMSAVRTSR